MEASIRALDDVTREVELTFSEGANAHAQIQVDEHIDEVGDLRFERCFRDIFYIKIGLASDEVHNETGKQQLEEGEIPPAMPESRERERRTWAGATVDANQTAA